MSAQLIKLANLLLASLLASLPLIASANTLERVQARNSLTLGYVPAVAGAIRPGKVTGWLR
ncbi:hypothetical protein [Pseudomonas sp. BF-RE-29]|uniref:hypothetical protein n=1 Tax=Pseudomonas sp. BF-RE-29 TaxID=2832378 RepID=UPI001CBFE7CF|nr:hypothetical protein [Pseudomonas sp. BF-RE-29]